MPRVEPAYSENGPLPAMPRKAGPCPLLGVVHALDARGPSTGAPQPLGRAGRPGLGPASRLTGLPSVNKAPRRADQLRPESPGVEPRQCAWD